MDMFTGDMENWLNYVEVNDTEHARLLRDMFKRRNFTDHDDASNVAYASELAHWVHGHFEYVTYARSNEIPGEQLPRALRVLTAREWSPGGELNIVYPSGSSVALRREDERRGNVGGHSTLEKIVRDSIDTGKTFDQTVDDATELISLDGNLVGEHLALKGLRNTIASTKITIDWQHPLSHTSGLLLTVNSFGIDIVPYDEPAVMPELFSFATESLRNPSELAMLASELMVIAAEYCPPRSRQYYTDREDIIQLEQLLNCI